MQNLQKRSWAPCGRHGSVCGVPKTVHEARRKLGVYHVWVLERLGKLKIFEHHKLDT